LNSGPHTCYTGALPLEPHGQPDQNFDKINTDSHRFCFPTFKAKAFFAIFLPQTIAGYRDSLISFDMEDRDEARTGNLLDKS
jgi:hypothetical protein